MAPQKTLAALDQVPVHEVPRDTLFRATQESTVDGEPFLKPGKPFIVPDTKKLPLVLKMFLAKGNESLPNAAFVSLQIRDVLLVLLLKNGPMDGMGEVLTSGFEPPSSAGEKHNIAPTLISAEAIPSQRMKVSDIPKNKTFYMARDYSHCSTDQGGYVTELPEGMNIGVNPMSDAIFIRKGHPFEMQQVSKRTTRGLVLVGQSYKQGTNFELDPNCEIEICFTE